LYLEDRMLAHQRADAALLDCGLLVREASCGGL
jgi:hypothetical protein